MDTNNIELGYLKVPTHKLNKVDDIMELRKGRPTFVDGDKDWEVIIKLFELWVDEYPEDYDAFKDSISIIKSGLTRADGISKEGEAMMQHQLEVPEMFHKMVKICYPDQVWDRKFVKGLAFKLPILKVADKI
jgi:hypothetical protein